MKITYIDDIKRNVEAANQVGMYGVHYTSHDRLIESLRELNINV